MKLLRGEQSFVECRLGCVATIGNFDGVHRGHRALLSLLRQKASRMQLPMVVVVFEPQPGEYFNPTNVPIRLYCLRQKLQALSQLGVDYVYCLRFNKQLACLSPEEFVKRFIVTALNAKYILVGDDFRFGCDRQGDLSTLRAVTQVETCLDFCVDNQRISSTRIRQALAASQLQMAADLLGRIYSISGRVMYGQGLARRLGFPTANIHVHCRRLPLQGVFGVMVHYRTSKLPGIANIGIRPTVNGEHPVLEVHLFDFNESLYGERLEVFFLWKIRDEIKFSSVEALVAQVQTDISHCRNLFTLKRDYAERECI